MDLALAGAGAASVVHALAASTVGARIVAVASRTSGRAEERAAQVGARAITYDALPAGADAVIVCTPPDRHVVDAVHCIEAGSLVLVDRPLASTLAAADELVARGDHVLYGENLAHSPIVGAVRDLARVIGRIGYVEIRLLSPRPSWGSYLDPERGGGVLLDLGSSAIALAMLLTGDRVATVAATADMSDGLAVDDRAELQLAMVSGTIVRIEVDWRSSGVMWDLQMSSDSDVVRADLAPAPAIEHNGEPVELPRRRFDVDPAVEWLGHAAQIEELARVVGGRSPSMDADFGRCVLEVVCAAYAAARVGSPIALPFEGPRTATPIDHLRGDS